MYNPLMMKSCDIDHWCENKSYKPVKTDKRTLQLHVETHARALAYTHTPTLKGWFLE